MESPAVASITTIVTALGGYALIVGVLFAFLSKAWLARIIGREKHGLQRQLDETNRRLQSELDKGLHIGKVQFEMELANYKVIWASLIDLRSATLCLRPSFDPDDMEGSKAERLKRRYKEVTAAFNDVGGLIEKNKPFYAPDVYDRACEVIKVCHAEVVHADTVEPPCHEHWDVSVANSERLLEAIESVCAAIRHRVWEVQVAT